MAARFPHSDILGSNARLAAPRGLSQPPTSFIGFWRQGIHRVPFLTWQHQDNHTHKMLALTMQFSKTIQGPTTTNQPDQPNPASPTGQQQPRPTTTAPPDHHHPTTTSRPPRPEPPDLDRPPPAARWYRPGGTATAGDTPWEPNSVRDPPSHPADRVPTRTHHPPTTRRWPRRHDR
jgi:hypothetical protein